MTLEVTAVVAWIVIGDEAPKADTDKFLTEGDLRPSPDARVIIRGNLALAPFFTSYAWLYENLCLLFVL